MTAEALARLFHDEYERLAPTFGYEVRPDVGGRPFDDLPDNNRALMIATAAGVLRELHRPSVDRSTGAFADVARRRAGWQGGRS